MDNLDSDVVHLINKLSELSVNDELDTGDYISLVATSMKIVEAMGNKSGEEKKILVTSVINRIVNESNDYTLKSILTPPTVSNLIEVIINASRGKYKLRSKYKSCKKRMGNCC